ncbi:MAG TPA: hypothetical protein VK824_00155, partial [Planctomycetota bacterium]|nr:hypothetical protein [Planctomycetota bacterium]
MRFTSILLSACAVSATSLAPAAAADVLVVDAANGAGAQFTQISAAVAVAADGDTLLVRAGSYGAVTVAGKALTISADTAATVTVNGALAVKNLIAGQTVVLRNLVVTGTSAPGLAASQCAGLVWAESCTLTGNVGGSGHFSAPGAVLTDCSSVVLVRCKLNGGAAGSFPFHQGASALEGTDSSISAFECRFTGSNGLFNDDLGGRGGDGAHLQGGSLYASASIFDGGNGGGADDDFSSSCQCVICGVPGQGGDGIEADAGELTLLENTLLPGLAGFSGSEKGCPDGAPGMGLQLIGSTLTELAGASRGLRVTSPLRELQSGQIIAFGTPGEAVTLLIGFAPANLLVLS